MGQNIEDRIMELVYEYPDKEFTVREIAKLTKIPRATVHKHILTLRKEGLIGDKNRAKNGLLFKTKKINYFIEKIVSSGLIDEFINNLNPSCIILFGSIRKGESIKGSDIDIFIESSVKKQINLDKYERKIGHKIQLFVEDNINKLQPNLFNNVINGIKLYGSFKIK